MTQSVVLGNESNKVKYPWMLGARDDLVYFLAPNIAAYAICMMAALKPDSFAGAAMICLPFLYLGNVFHQGATWFHYTDKRNRDYYFGTAKQKFKFIALPILILVFSVIGGLTYAPIVWLIYMGWSLPHFIQQNAGILLLYHNYNRGEAIVNRDLEMRSQQFAGVFFYLVAIHRSLFASTAIAPFSAAIVGIAFVSFAGTTLLYLWHLSSQVKQGAYLNMPAFFFWIASILFLLPFALPISNFDVGWILPSLMHWWQYIGLNYVIVKCKYADEHQRQFIPSQRPILFFIGFCALITLIQYGPYAFLHFQSPQIQYMNVWNSLFLGLGMVHYLLDGFIWRFREQYNREALLVPLLNARAQRQSPAMGPTQ